MERLFILIARINSVLFLLILLCAAGSIALMTLGSNRWQRRGAVEVHETESGLQKQILLSFEKIESIAGANTQMMRLTTQDKSGKLSSGGYGNETRNILFLVGTEKTARWLFKDHKHHILDASQLKEGLGNSKERPTTALYFEYVTEDTNGDGRLSSADDSHIGLAKPDGTGFLEVLHDASRVFSYKLLDQRHLSVVYQKGSTVRHTKFSLASMKPEADQEIINVPSTL